MTRVSCPGRKIPAMIQPKGMIMNARPRFLLTWIGLAVFITAGFSGIYLHFSLQARTEEFRARAELLAWTFADRASFDLAQGNPQDLEFLAGSLVLGNVLYAQIIREEQVLAEVNPFSLALTPATPPTGIWQIESKNSGHQAYWDIRRALSDVGGYVRLGLALEPLESANRSQLYLVVGIGIAFLAFVILITAYWARRLFTVTDPLPLVEITPTSVPVPPDPLVPSATSNTSILQMGHLMIDDASKHVSMHGQRVELSPTEFELLRLLASEPGRVFSNHEILSRVWPESHLATAQDVKQYIYFLRQKLEENPKDPQLILTARGFGYKLHV